MKFIVIIAVVLAICLAGFMIFSEEKVLLLDDFEGAISGGPNGTVDFGAGAGSSVEVSAETMIKYSGKQSLKVVFDAVPDGYMWVARGFGLDAKNTMWLIKPNKIKWPKYKALTFEMYGNNSKARVAFDIKDSGNEIWRFMVDDNFTGWKKITCPLNEFFARGDWQPDSADKNAVLNFPVKSFQFEPRPQARGTLYFDHVELTK